MTLGDLIRARQADLRERFEAQVELVESGEATYFSLDEMIREAEWLAVLVAARLAELRQLHGDPSAGDG